MQSMSAWVGLKEVVGERVAPADVRQAFRAFGWAETFVSLARVADVLANDRDGVQGAASRAWAKAALDDLGRSGHPLAGLVADHARAELPARTFAHEEVLYVLQALAILEGREEGPTPSDAGLAFWMVAVNDHLGGWFEPDLQALTEVEDAVASFGHVSRFNQGDDHVRRLARTALMLHRAPPRGRFADSARWAELQDAAFGMAFEAYFDVALAPLAMWSVAGSRLSGRAGPLVVNPSRWLAETRIAPGVGATFLADLTWTREAARAELAACDRPDALPHAPTLFYRRPFVEVAGDVIVPASPWVLREQLRGGVWGRYRAGAERLLGRRGPEEWLRTFGDLFECWCREVAGLAARTPGFADAVVTSDSVGDADEIEDVVLLSDGAVALCSAKAGLLPEKGARAARSRPDVLAWFERFLFARSGGGHRGGALRLLSKKIDRIRAGASEPTVPREHRVFPVLVTFEDLGENPALRAWIADRCRAEGLLTQARVAPLTLASIDEFEALLAVASHGRSVFDVLALRDDPAVRLVRLDALLVAVDPVASHHRLPGIHDHFDAVTERVGTRLFGASWAQRPSKASR